MQPGGLYHYHGIPDGLINTAANTGDLVWVGYAADGHRLLYSRSGKFQSSYSLKTGQRDGGPGGAYTGLYTQDWVYQAGAGDLDPCNGTTIDGEYVYLMTKDFPTCHAACTARSMRVLINAVRNFSIAPIELAEQIECAHALPVRPVQPEQMRPL